MLDQWLDVLGNQDINLTSTEIADICWLAMIQQRFGVEQPKQSRASRGSASPNQQTLLESNAKPSEFPEIPQRESPQPAPQPVGSLFTRKSATGLQTDAKLLRVPTPPAIRDSLSLARALRPLMKQYPIGQGSQLDEVATVQKIAEERVWCPVSRPETEKWLELALVVDESPSMLVWRRTVKELARLFKHYGIFRDVRLWGLMVKEVDCGHSFSASNDDEMSKTSNQELNSNPESSKNSKVFIRANPFSRFQINDLRQPDSLIEPAGRRLILIISDCVDEIWQEPSLLSTLKLWSQCSPLALLQMMPEWSWPRTNLRQTTLVNFQSKNVGSVNQALDVVLANTTYFRKTKAEKQADIKVPVITLEFDRIHLWTQMLTAQGGYQAPGVIFNPHAQAMSVAAQQRRQQKESASNQSFGKAQTFRGAASPIARRLASLLAASPAITQPVIRIVQETLLPQSEQVHVAEVLLGGILKPEKSPSLETNPDDVRYQFIEEDTRSALLAEAPITDTTVVLSTYIQDNFNKSLEDFILELRRLMSFDTANQDELKPIATIAAEVLQYRGQEYADFVREVKNIYGPSLPTTDENKPLSNIFPDLKSFEFIDARYIDTEQSSFPPPLQTESFTILSLQPEESIFSPIVLESFNFTVAKLIGSQKIWKIQQQQQSAQRYVERLSNEIDLEMISVPSGTFVIGSPKNEPKRYDREGPQHQVTVESFLMGRYPITQNQWRVVTNLPQINHELGADITLFKGDNKPIERVTWYAAVEFCARLSSYTGHKYRLPSEAEWEYACRAGTTTPFHFGDTITTDVANYNGSAYADGPTGKSRNGTTPVDHFGIANAFGLADMHGNVWEWCQDHWHSNYEDAPKDGSAWLTDNDTSRILRGGSWNYAPWDCRSAYRYAFNPGYRDDSIGFRVVCSAPRILQ